MPKSMKQKQAKVADFSKAKLKLGKGKQQAQNATDTSYKARSIVLPTQSIAVDKPTTEPVTKRNQTFEELLVHAKHYNAGIRKDALLGFRELFLLHPHLLSTHLPSLLSALLKLLPDPSPQVRSSLLSLLSSLLPLTPSSLLAPHLPLLLLHTSSALANIFPEVRIDAVKVLGVVMGSCTREDLEGEVGGRMREGLMGVLGLGGGWVEPAGTSGGAQGGSSSGSTGGTTTLGPAAKLTVLQTLTSFLDLTLASPSSSSSANQTSSSSASSTISSEALTSFFAPSFSTPSAFSEFTSLLSKGKMSTLPSFTSSSVPLGDWASLGGGGAWDLADFGGGLDLNSVLSTPVGGAAEGGQEGASRSSNSVEAARLYLQLHPLLLSTFLDTAPTAFSPSSSGHVDVNMELVCTVGELVGILGRTVLRDAETVPKPLLTPLKSSLRTLLSHMSIYFPFTSPSLLLSTSSRTSSKANPETLLLQLSLQFSSLVSLLSLTSAHLPPPSKSSLANPNERKKALEECYARMRKGMNKGEKVLVGKVGEWVAGLLRGEVVSPSSPLGTPLPAQTYLSLLPTIWSLLNQPPPPPSASVTPTPSSSSSSSRTTASRSKPQAPPAMDVDSSADSPEPSIPSLVLSSLLDHLHRLPSTSETKKIGLEFVARLCLLETLPLYTAPFRIAKGSGSALLAAAEGGGGGGGVGEKVERFYESLPKMLWELGGKDLGASETILSIMHNLLLSRPSNPTPSSSASTRPLPGRPAARPTPTSTIFQTSILPSLPPYFHLDHPTRGPTPGPFTKLPLQSATGRRVRRLALVVASLGSKEGGGGEDGTRLREAVEKALSGEEGGEERAFWEGLDANLDR